MSNSQGLSEQFAAIMDRADDSSCRSRASSSGPSCARYEKTIPTQTRRTKGAFPAHGYNTTILPTRVSSNEIDSKLSLLQKNYDTVVRGFHVLEAKLKDTQEKLTITQEQARSAEDSARSAKDRTREVEEQVHSAEARNATLVAEAEVAQNDLTARESELKDLRRSVEESVTCGVCQSTFAQPYSVECRHIFCAVCLISWWQASNRASCPTCRRVSTRVPVREHSHETLIEAVLANSGEREDPGPFNPRVFEEFLRKREVEEMEGRGFMFPRHEELFVPLENEEPFDTIDLTGDDDSD